MDPSDSASRLGRIYIGEAESITERLRTHQHQKNKSFYTQIVVLVSRDDSFTKAHARYLEAELFNIIKEAGRYDLENTQIPRGSNISEAAIFTMNTVIRNLKLILPALGINALRTSSDAILDHNIESKDILDSGGTAHPRDLDTNETAAHDFSAQSVVFTLQINGKSASMIPDGGDFIVLKGSYLRNKENITQASIENLRRELLAQEILKETENPKFLVFTQDYVCKSASAAAKLITGNNVNGRIL